MNVEMKAKNFSIKSYKNQIRKSDPEKSMIIHPIDVASILKKYDFDENVIAAGYLHDVVEYTKYTEKDIERKFGNDISSLVMGVSELDKSLSCKERQKQIIENIKDLDLRHKAVICADKISNLEDLRIILEVKAKYDFFALKREFEDQKGYYKGVYDSLIYNEDENFIMFKRLKELIDYIFENKANDEYMKNNIFKDDQERYKRLLQVHYKKEEVYKMMKALKNNFLYTIEFVGTPRTGKTSLINNLNDFFKKKEFNVDIIEEFTTSKKYRKDIFPILKDKLKYIINTEIVKYMLNDLNKSLKHNNDIIIIDRSLFDRLIWVDILNIRKEMSNDKYEDYKELYIPLIKEKIDIVIATYADGITALKRDYNSNLSLEKRNFLNEENINEYNQSLVNMKKLAEKENINFYMFDTTNKNQSEISLEIVNVILDDMKKRLIKELK